MQILLQKTSVHNKCSLKWQEEQGVHQFSKSSSNYFSNGYALKIPDDHYIYFNLSNFADWAIASHDKGTI